MSQKTAFFLVTAVKPSDLTNQVETCAVDNHRRLQLRREPPVLAPSHYWDPSGRTTL
jgi:hypothetical protein